MRAIGPRYDRNYVRAIAVALDGLGRVHIAISDVQNLRHVLVDGSKIVTSVLAGGEGANVPLSGAADAAGRGHVAYLSWLRGAVLVDQGPGGWTDTVMNADHAGSGMVGAWVKLAIGPDGATHVAYLDRDASDEAFDLRYAVRVEGRWSEQRVDGGAAAIGFAPDGDVRLAFYAGGHYVYAAPSDGEWRMAPLPVSDNYSVNTTSFALDGHGGVHLAMIKGCPSYWCLGYASGPPPELALPPTATAEPSVTPSPEPTGTDLPTATPTAELPLATATMTETPEPPATATVLASHTPPVRRQWMVYLPRLLSR